MNPAVKCNRLDFAGEQARSLSAIPRCRGSCSRKRGTPLVGALVYAAGASRAVRTDEGGAFRLQDLLPGRYTISCIREGGESGERLQEVDVEVLSADTTITLRERARAGFLTERCGPGYRAAATGIVLGRVLADTLPARFAPVSLRDPQGRVEEATTDASGRFVFCDVGSEARIETARGSRQAVRHVALQANEVLRVILRLPSEEGAVAEETVISEGMAARLAADSLAAVEAHQDAVLARALERVPGSAVSTRVIGVVVDDGSSSPVAGARVVDERSGVEVVTDKRGAFRFEARASTLYLHISHVAFEDVRDTIPVGAGEVVHLDVRLGVIALARSSWQQGDGDFSRMRTGG